MAQIRCPSCGWENETGARICGGCGRMLTGSTRANVPGSAAYTPRGAGLRSGYNAYGAVDETDPDTPTVRDYPPIPASRPQVYQQAYVPSAQRGPAPQWSPAPPYRSVSPAGRIALVALVIVALFAVIGAGAWAALVRPKVHQQVDSALRSQLTSMVATFNHLPAIPTSDLTITGDDATASLQAGLPSDVPVQNVQVSFQGGRTLVTYTAYGVSGSVSTSLEASSGRLTAQDTIVSGPMDLVESSDELQSALSDVLASVRHDVTFKQVTEQNGTLTVSVKGTV